MARSNLCKIGIAVCICILSFKSADVIKAATENDLREVMGIGRLDTDEEAKALAMSMIRECTKNKQHNEMADLLQEYDLESYSDQLELAESGENAYTEVMSLFKSAKPAEKITPYLSSYETYYQNWEGEYTHTSYDIEKIDEESIEEKLVYANTILATINSTEDIGTVGLEMITPTKEDQMLVTELEEGSATFSTSEDQRIYCILNGTVTSVSANRITIECGSTIKLTYSGVLPSVEEGQKITQGRKIGKALGDEIKISAEVTGESANPLLMYGKRGKIWYQEFQEGSAQDEDDRITLKINKVKDYVEEDDQDDESDNLSPIDNQNTGSILTEDPFLTEEDDSSTTLPSSDNTENTENTQD